MKNYDNYIEDEEYVAQMDIFFDKNNVEKEKIINTIVQFFKKKNLETDTPDIDSEGAALNVTMPVRIGYDYTIVKDSIMEPDTSTSYGYYEKPIDVAEITDSTAEYEWGNENDLNELAEKLKEIGLNEVEVQVDSVHASYFEDRIEADIYNSWY